MESFGRKNQQFIALISLSLQSKILNYCMKKHLLISSLACIFAVTTSNSQCVTYTSAVSDVTLQSTGGTGNRTAVAYYPTKNMYYSVNAGNSSYPIQTFTYTGGTALSTIAQAADYRGLWYNPNLGTIEGNEFGDGGVYRHDINQVTGYAAGTVSNVAATTMPNSQSAGAYDPVNNHILYYNATTLYKYNRATNALVTSMAITGLPTSSINSYHIIYTGIPGSEVGVYDFTNKAVYFINYSTGAYVSTCQLPVTAPGASSFKFSYANNRVFLYDGIGNWFGYKITNQADLLYTGSNFVCSGLPLTVTISGANTYTWSTGSNSSSISVTPSVTTIYSVAATNSLGCTNTSNFVVSIGGTPPTLSTTASNTFFCGNGSATLTASGATSYAWNTGALTSSVNVTPSVTTIYTVTGSNGSGCDDIETLTVTVENNPTVTVSAGTNTLCEGATTSLTASGAASYTWNTGSGSSVLVITPSVSTSYTVIGSSANGCTGSNNTSTISVSVFANPTVNAVSNTSLLCTGQTATLTGSGASTYSWSTGGSNASIAVSPTTTTTYTVYGTDSIGCSNNAVITQSVSACTGIESIVSETNHIHVYPNPGNGIYFLSFLSEGEKQIEIFDAVGRLIQSQKVNGLETTVDLTPFENGIYLIVLKEQNSKTSVTKIIKH